MPELPEVETIVRSLQPRLTGLNFVEALVTLPKVIRTPGADDFKEKISGKKIITISRRGKYLLFHLNEKLNLLVHLRMTGSLVYCSPEEAVAKHTHLIFSLSNGYQLRYTDMRQFGRFSLLPNQALHELAGYKDLGPEPLEANFTAAYLKKELQRRRGRLKPLLLDQTFIAGLGNIYTDEALHRAKINPERQVSTLTPEEATALHQAIGEVLREGIANRGTTVRDFIDGNGQPGGFQMFLRAYGKEGRPCHYCGANIVRKKIGGRSSYFCPACQKN